jgi:hypothetical protein
MYGSGAAERGYYTPRESAEWEVEVSSNVDCSNAECADFEQPTDADVRYRMSGMYGVGEWVCPTCQTTQTSEREFDDDYFIDPDAGRD